MLDIPDLLKELASRRPVFHSEADFQHELALLIRDRHPSFQVRLEYPLARPANAAIDIIVRHVGALIALELKYMSRRIECEVDGEHFSLKFQSAQDTRRYDVLKDVSRMEQFVAQNPSATAAVIVLTNDPYYWNGRRRQDTNDAAFDLRHDRQIEGTLNWSERASPGTKRTREKALVLTGQHRLEWRDYSDLGCPSGLFRYLCIPVSSNTRVCPT